MGFFRDLSGVLLVNVRVGRPPLDIWNIYNYLLENRNIYPDNRESWQLVEGGRQEY